LRKGIIEGISKYRDRKKIFRIWERYNKEGSMFCHNNELHNLKFSFPLVKMIKRRMGRTCSRHGEQKIIQNFDKETSNYISSLET
jgi:hypothetical protein